MAGLVDGAQAQIALFPGDEPRVGSDKDGLGLTFRDSKSLPIHGWYPYVEGFSAQYIENLVREFGAEGVVYDPFGGSGTVNLIASQLGVESAFSEANPFMRFVAETKVNARQEAQGDRVAFKKCADSLRRWVATGGFEASVDRQDLASYADGFNGRDFFDEGDLRQLLALREGARFFAGGSSSFRDLLLLAVASITVACSHMTRRADLRRRRSDEYLTRIVDVRKAFLSKLAQVERDVGLPRSAFSPARFVSADARAAVPELYRNVSLVLTSPPYLNGTNYMRNTKLELWLMGFIKSERELSGLNKVCMVCGINNVAKNRPAEHTFGGVEAVADKLDRISPDLRIPALVRGYFSDMLLVLRNCASYLRRDGRLVLDIGDSKFYGVHVPTDRLLIEVASESGLKLIGERVLARRHSRDKTPLTQVELTFSHAS